MSDSTSKTSRFAAIFAGGTLLSRVLGLVRNIVLAKFIPGASLDMFLLAFKLPNMLRDMLGEGAVNAAFVPVLSEEKETGDKESFRRLASACFAAMLLVFLAITLAAILLIPFVPALMEWLRPLSGAEPKDVEYLATTVLMMQWTFPYLVFIGLAAFAMAPLFVVGHYSTPSWSPALLNIALIVTCVGLYRYFEEPSWALILGIWLGGLGQFAVLYWAMYRYTGVTLPSFQLRHPGVRRAFLLLGPIIAGQAAGEVNKLVDGFFAYSVGAVSTLFFANQLVQLPLSVFGIAVSVAILPSLSRAGARGDKVYIGKALQNGWSQTAFLIFPAMLGLMVLAEPIVRLVYERGEFSTENTRDTATALCYYAAGLWAFAWVKISVQGFFAIQNTKTPVIIASGSMIMNIILNILLIGPMGFRGLALATTLSFTMNFLVLFWLLCRYYGPLYGNAEFLGSILRISGVSIFMAAGVYAVRYILTTYFSTVYFTHNFLLVVLPIGIGVGMYLALSWWTGSPELRAFQTALWRRKL